MSRAGNERLIYTAAVVAVVLSALATLMVDNDEVEVAFFMLTAVVAGLLCFDTAMNRRLRSFTPWALLSLAPALKTVPSVWLQLRSESGLLFERYDHAGSLLFGLCVVAAVVVVSRPSPVLGHETAWFDLAIIAGSSLTAGLAGASVAFLFDRDFGSATAGRVLETPTWFVVGALLASTALAIGHSRGPSIALTGVLATAAATAALLALSAAGRDFDPGWWALLFAALALSAAWTDAGPLGNREDRDRRTYVGVVVTMVAGVVAAGAAIAARSDRTSWGPGWALLGVVSLGMFALAMANRPLDEPGRGAKRRRAGIPEIGVGGPDTERASRAKARALRSLRTATPTGQPEVSPVSQAIESTVAEIDDVARAEERTDPAGRTIDPAVDESESRPIQPAVSPVIIPQAEPGRKPLPTRSARPPAAAAIKPDGPASAGAQGVGSETVDEDAVLAATTSREALSDAGLVASARAAAEVRTAPSAQRHSLAPLAQAHHFDPSTGLLSAAGLQHAIGRAFDVPRQAGHVTIMMFTIRDLDRIEREHGRLASAAVTREVAERIRTLLPAGDGARFARSAYAVIFVGDLSAGAETVQRLARALLQLRAPVELGTFGDKIDVVAGMAQCYESEDAAEFVKRANLGLARAVQTVEPTFVAMP